MKRTSLIIIIALVFCGCGYGQRIRDTTGKYKLGGTIVESTNIDWMYDVKLTDLTIHVSPGYDTLKYNITIEGDTMACFRLFYRDYLELQSKLKATEEILKYVKINGTSVSPKDKIKFDKAVKEYLTNKNLF